MYLLDNAPVKLDDCFIYLGCHFDFKMTDDKHKSELIETFTKQTEIIDQLHRLSKISWHLTVTNISNTWMKNNFAI